MRLLELFSGTGSIGRAFRSQGWEVHSLDIEPGATIVSDIMHWDYRQLPPGHYDFIWASPPCTEYSIARTRAKRPRDFERADAVVEKTLEIIEYFAPIFWLLENPQTGYLKNREIIAGLPWRDVTYCKYGYPYKKQTRLWGHFPFTLRPACSRKDPCGRVEGGRHPGTAQRFDQGYSGQRRTLQELYSIPPELCDHIAAITTVWVE